MALVPLITPFVVHSPNTPSNMKTRLLPSYLWIALMAISLTFTSCQKEMEGVQRPSIAQEVDDADVLVSVEEAQQIAQTFIANNLDAVSSLRSARDASLELVYTDLGDLRSLDAKDADPNYYIFNIDTVGFVIVSASENTLPVIGYSEESAFTSTNIPESMRAYLSNAKYEISASKALKPTRAVQEMRRSAIEGRSDLRVATSVAPLLGRIKWNQRPYYNDYCPSGTPVGCVATATAQIMKYYEYPDRGQGEHAYYSSYGVLSFNYNYDIPWDQMPEERLTRTNKQVAYFNYGVAVSLDMGFGPNGSGTWQWMVPNALKTYYKYPNTVGNRDRKDYTDAQWKNIVRRELDAGRPVQYCGGGTGGAHSFVCDGYTESGYFHFNWGWGGMSDGYFLLDRLNPGSLGTGGGAGGYNYNQSIVVGFAPPEGHNPINRDDYCTTGSQYSCTTYIAKVSLGEMSNPTAGCSNGGYVLYSDAGTYTQGSEYTLQVFPGFSYDVYPEYWRVWIDFDGDKSFAENEIVLSGTTTTRAGLQRTFAIPEGAKVGSTRMRVSMKWGGYPEACETFKHGEVEDYIINIAAKKAEPKPDPKPEPAPGGYCAAQGWNSCSTYIAGVQLANINNPSEGCTKGYKYFDGMTIKVAPGKSYNMTLTPGFRTTAHDEYWRVWVDFNDDKIFGADELILSGKSRLRNALTKSITIPANAQVGKTLRMRVLMSYDDTTEPCAVFDYGEVEDYNLVVEKTVAPKPDPTPNPTPTPNPDPTPTPTPGVYCTPSAASSAGAYIRFFEFGGIENQSTYQSNGYSNFTAKSTRALAGASIRYTISPDSPSEEMPYYYRIWIDYNGNKSFDADEVVVQTSDTHSVYGRFTLRRNLAKGNYRVRVAMKVGAYPEACEAIEEGEFEDYTLTIR